MRKNPFLRGELVAKERKEKNQLKNTIQFSFFSFHCAKKGDEIGTFGIKMFISREKSFFLPPSQSDRTNLHLAAVKEQEYPTFSFFLILIRLSN